MKMLFGKFKGLDVTELPDQYLGWLQTLDLRDPLRMGVEREAQRRAQQLSPEVLTLADLLITVGYQRLAKHYQGEDRRMLHEAREILHTWLDEQIADTGIRRAA